jgi:hypothetical protein
VLHESSCRRNTTPVSVNLQKILSRDDNSFSLRYRFKKSKRSGTVLLMLNEIGDLGVIDWLNDVSEYEKTIINLLLVRASDIIKNGVSCMSFICPKNCNGICVKHDFINACLNGAIATSMRSDAFHHGLCVAYCEFCPTL